MVTADLMSYNVLPLAVRGNRPSNYALNPSGPRVTVLAKGRKRRAARPAG
jgi:hypothetical protein